MMAEFQEVMRQFKRLCDSADQDCSSCALKGMSCGIWDFVNLADDLEKRIMAWAAEHPEPVYPTWGEWLQTLYRNTNYAGIFITPIPADIAQKLGIEPKEG